MTVETIGEGSGLGEDLEAHQICPQAILCFAIMWEGSGWGEDQEVHQICPRLIL